MSPVCASRCRQRAICAQAIACFIALFASSLAAESVPVKLGPNDCGQVCVYTACKLLDVPVTLDQVFAGLPSREEGTSLRQLGQYLESQRLHAFAVRLRPEQLPELEDVAIGYLRGSSDNTLSPHFFLLVPLSQNRVQLIDYPNAPFVIGRDALARMGEEWQGEMLVVSRRSNLSWRYGRAPLVVSSVLIAAAGATCVFGWRRGQRTQGQRVLRICSWLVLGLAVASMLGLAAGPAWSGLHLPR